MRTAMRTRSSGRVVGKRITSRGCILSYCRNNAMRRSQTFARIALHIDQLWFCLAGRRSTRSRLGFQQYGSCSAARQMEGCTFSEEQNWARTFQKNGDSEGEGPPPSQRETTHTEENRQKDHEGRRPAVARAERKYGNRHRTSTRYNSHSCEPAI